MDAADREGLRKLEIAGPYDSDDGDVLTQWAFEGRGIINKPLFEVKRYLNDGTLVEILKDTPPGQCATGGDLSAQALPGSQGPPDDRFHDRALSKAHRQDARIARSVGRLTIIGLPQRNRDGTIPDRMELTLSVQLR